MIQTKLRSGLYFIRQAGPKSGCVVELDGEGRYRSITYESMAGWSSCNLLPQPDECEEFFPVTIRKSKTPGNLMDSPMADPRELSEKHWRECASIAASSEEYYRGVVRELGRVLGVESFISDDGSIQSDPLAAKMRDLVVAREAERLAAVAILNQIGAAINGSCIGRNAALESILPCHSQLPRQVAALVPSPVDAKSTAARSQESDTGS